MTLSFTNKPMIFMEKKISKKYFAVAVRMRLLRKSVTGVTCYREQVSKRRIGVAAYVFGVSRFGARRGATA
jgi:uncharacterized membrane protein